MQRENTIIILKLQELETERDTRPARFHIFNLASQTENAVGSSCRFWQHTLHRFCWFTAAINPESNLQLLMNTKTQAGPSYYTTRKRWFLSSVSSQTVSENHTLPNF